MNSDDNNDPTTSIITVTAPSSDLHFYLIAFAIAACSPDDRIRALGCILFALLIAAFLAIFVHAMLTKGRNDNTPTR